MEELKYLTGLCCFSRRCCHECAASTHCEYLQTDLAGRLLSLLAEITVANSVFHTGLL